MMTMINHPQIIFDSRIAVKSYKDYDYYRTDAFDVPGGYNAVVELTTHTDYLKNLLFTAIRLPAESDDSCLSYKGLGKRYRRWRCCQSLGTDQSENPLPTQYTDYNKSVVRWGWDHINEEIVEFEYITRPGKYYLIGDKCDNGCIEDCKNPTIIEYTLIPVSTIHDLSLPCCD